MMATGYEMTRAAPKHDHDPQIHLDKGLMSAFAAVLFALLVQTGSFIWWASSMSTSVVSHDKRLSSMEAWRDASEKNTAMLVEVKVGLEFLDKRVTKLETTTGSTPDRH